MTEVESEEQTPAENGRVMVVESLLASWSAEDERIATRTRMASEIARFLEGQGSSLPYRGRDGVAWVTIGPSPAELQRQVELLRAWVIPSFGWEDPRQPFVAPGEAIGPLATALLKASPAGYFRWRCTTEDFSLVADRLARMRAVAARRPEHLYERVPSLLELRQQFRTALLTGARESAEAAIGAIDQYQLDSAVNTHLMRVRMLDEFRNFAAIVDDPAIEQLLELRLPQSVRSALVRAFYVTRVAAHEAEGAEAAAVAYREQVHPVVGGLLALSRFEDGPEVARSLAYRAWVTGDVDEAAALLPMSEPAVASLLRSVVETRTHPGSATGLGGMVADALRRSDMRALQDLAPSILAGLAGSSSDQLLTKSLDAVRESLEVRPNPILAATLAQSGAASMAVQSMPQTWSELISRLREGDLAAAERFLALDEVERPSPELLSAAERDAALSTLEELLTDPAYAGRANGRWIADVALPAFVEDFVSDRQFPRSEFLPLYMQLLRLWAEHKCGSAYAPDGQLMLLLSSAILQRTPGHEEEIAALLIDWWRARPVRAALTFLLEALDLVLEFTASEGPAQQLWLDGASLAARESGLLSGMERVLWRTMGLRAGFDARAVDEVLPKAPAPLAEETTSDVLRDAGLSKIAIVSLHRRPAEAAGEILAERTGASVFVVDETVAGPGTRAAQTADVVLFVWAATKHAVFRAFDAVRDRVVYVPGTGANSIVLALERWAAARP